MEPKEEGGKHDKEGGEPNEKEAEVGETGKERRSCLSRWDQHTWNILTS